MTSVEVDIYSDFICPWCYIGKSRLHRISHLLKDEIELIISVKPFILYPHIPVGGTLKSEFANKTKPGMGKSLRYEAKIEGIELNYGKIERIPNSLQAHKLTSLVVDSTIQFNVSRSIIRSYFKEGKDIEDIELLTEAARACGVDANIINTFRNTRKGNTAILQEIEDAKSQFISLVPTLRLNKTFILPGLQSEDVWIKYIKRAAKLVN